MLKELISFGKSKIEKEYFYYNSLLKNLNQKIIAENNKIIFITTSLENEVEQYSNYFKTLQQSIDILRNKLKVKKGNIVDDIHIIEHSDKDDLNKKDIKKLYRIIASKCHPDKTTNKELNDLFILAAEAYSNYNYILLLEIYSKVIDNDVIDKTLPFEKRLEIIKQEYNNRKIEFDNITKTNGYVLKSLMESKKPKDNYIARKLFLDLLFNKIIEFEQLKEELENNLNRQ